MKIDLANLNQNDIDNFVSGLKHKGSFNAESVEGCCRNFTQELYESCLSPEGVSQLVLSRIFIVLHFTQLTESLKAHVTSNAGSLKAEDLNYLVLFGTYGKEKEWCSRDTSQGHKAIPLTEETVKTIPMVARCLQQVGFNLDIILSKNKDSGIVLEGMSKLYGVFYVQNAKDSPYIPAQENFVIPYGVQSVIGSGTCVPAGVPMIYIGFSRVAIPQTSAPMFAPLMTSFGRNLAAQFTKKACFGDQRGSLCHE